MRQVFEVEFQIMDGKANYPVMKKEVTVNNEKSISQAVFNLIWNNRQGYGVTKNFTVNIISCEFDSYTL